MCRNPYGGRCQLQVWIVSEDRFARGRLSPLMTKLFDAPCSAAHEKREIMHRMILRLEGSSGQGACTTSVLPHLALSAASTTRSKFFRQIFPRKNSRKLLNIEGWEKLHNPFKRAWRQSKELRSSSFMSWHRFRAIIFPHTRSLPASMFKLSHAEDLKLDWRVAGFNVGIDPCGIGAQ